MLERLSGEGAEVVLRAGKPLALLQLLRVAEGRPVPREQLADQLWGDESPENARASLRQAGYALRQVLGESGLTSDREVMAVDPAMVACDRAALIAAARAGDFETMLALATGPFWEGSLTAGADGFERWADSERRRLDGLVIDQATVAIPQRLARADADGARRAALALAHRFPERSDIAILCFDTLVATGAITEATERLSAHAARLLAMEYTPPPEVEERLARLRRRPASAAPVSPGGLYAVGETCVGRDALLLDLLREAEQARNGNPRRVLLVGPAGVGKTRVLDELEARLRLRGARVLRVGFLPGMSDVELSALTNVVRALAALPGALGVGERSARRLLAFVPELSDRFPGAARAGAIVDEGLLGLPEAMDDLLAAVAEDRPVVLMLDNMEFSDMASLRVFASTLLRPGTRLFAVGTSRRSVTPSLSAGATVLMDVRPLGEQEIRALLRAVATLPDAPWMHELVATLLRRSLGIPQVALAAVRSLGAAGLLRVEQGLWHCDDPTALLRAARESAGTASLVGGLDARSRELLDLLALWGRPLEERDLAGILDLRPDQQPLTALRQTLRRLEALGLIESREATWSLAHAAVAEELPRHPAPVAAYSPWELLLRYWTTDDRLTVAIVDHLAWIAGRDGPDARLPALMRAAWRSGALRAAGLRGAALATHLARAAGHPERAAELRSALGFWARQPESVRTALAVLLTFAALGAAWLAERLQPRIVVGTEAMAEQPGLNRAVALVVQPRVLVENGFGRRLRTPVDLRLRSDFGRAVGDTLRRTVDGSVQFERIAVVKDSNEATPRPVHLSVHGPWYVRSGLVPVRGLTTATLSDEFRVTAVEVNGRRVSDSLIVVARPGDSLRVDLTFEYTTVQATANYIVGAAATWEPRERASIRLAGLPRPVRDAWRHVSFAVPAPTVPGDHYIAILFDLEDTVEHLFSGTSWQAGEPVWGDGNDIQDQPREFFESLRLDGRAMAQRALQRTLRTRQGDVRVGDSVVPRLNFPAAVGERLRIGRALLVRVVP